MKKTILLMLICFVVLICNAQSNHLSFKGIPIEGTVSDFSTKLAAQNYRVLESNENTCFLIGNFAGCDDVTIAVVGTPKTNIVYRITVFFDKRDSFSSLNVQYESFVKRYTDKYGKPEQSYSFFLDPYYKGDGYELQALRQNKCRYISFFDVSNGHISIEISKLQKVVVNYEDLIGVKLYNEEKDKIVDNDI